MSTDAHHNEYLAAIAGLPEQTVSPMATKHEPAVGDFVSGCTAGKRWSGRVEWIDGPLVCINPGGAWLYVPLSDITH